MAWRGDHTMRPAEVHTIIPATPQMLQEALVLGTNTTVAWFDRDIHATKEDVAVAICKLTGALAPDVTVTDHHPEAFLIRFIHHHHCSLAVGQREVPFGEARLQVRAWRLEDHAEPVNLDHHVRLCLEGLPLHAWDEHAISNAIGAACSLEYVEPASKLKTETKVVGLWAWVSCPSKVPRINWITLPGRNGGQPVYGRRGFEHRVLIHLAIHEDSTGPSIVSTPYDWRYNIVDDKSKPRDRRERISRPV